MQPLLNQLNSFLNKNKWVIALYWVVAIILLTLPGNQFPNKNWFKIFHVDKWIHIGLFSGLTFVSLSITKKNSLKKIYFIATFCTAFGIAIEFIQEAFIVNRSFDNWDIVADAVGVLIVLILFKNYIKNK